MSRFLMILSAVTLATILAVSCSGGRVVPTSPDLQTPGGDRPEACANTHLWGAWDVTLDPAARTADIVPLRGADFTANVTQFMQPPASSKHMMSIVIDPSSDFAVGHVVVDVTFAHPFPGLDLYTGFDVRGVCIGDGVISGIVDPLIRYAASDDLRVLNADGMTRWFNPSEFTSYGTMFGFTRGKLGTPSDNWLATLNGYRYFCDGLGKEDDLMEFLLDPACANPRGYFSAGNSLTRRYDLQFPMVGGAPQFRFQYAVVASWLQPMNNPPMNIPDDFPTGANCQEAFASLATDQSEMYYVDSSLFGGTLELTLTVLDHQGALEPSTYLDEITAIHLETPDGLIDGKVASFEGPDLAAAVTGTSEDGIEFLLTVPDVTPYATGDFPVLVVIESADPDNYGSGFPGFVYPTSARLAAYFTASVHVTDEMPYKDPVAVAEIATPKSPYYKGDHLNFDATGSYDPDNDIPGEGIVTYEWDWDNDGTYDETGPEAWHTWDAVGTYYVQLRVTDDESATGTLDEPMEVEILAIPSPQLIADLTGFHSPYCSQVDMEENDGWVDCTQAAPVLDFGFYRIGNDESVEKVFQKTGGGFFGMPGPFDISSEARKILAPNMLSFGDLLVDLWDLDGGAGKQFYLPVDVPTGIFFCGDVKLFADLSVAVLSDPIAKRLITWDYTQSSPTYTIYWTAEFPNILEGDMEGDRLFVYCRNSPNPYPVVEVRDAEDWSVITTFVTDTIDYPMMSDMDYDPYRDQLCFGSDDIGNLEVWDAGTYTHVQTINSTHGAVQGVDHMGGAIYVTAPGRLIVFDADTLSKLWDVPCGNDPRIITCNPHTHKMYIPDMSTSHVYVYEL